ncbi:hypothetical protein EDEG_03575 [Edhazardia aedis USNM 41457]|uniref:Uncharacterized protein n=1 Tax=Edhazardia aedis (strain USNM 41457) TaxID=1003232 RepID=J9D301_EDHAE|nr:hypothetical protein EDEG_03575 [Edhazardia aedis USNM 41457]|eukprot:EJW01949.1 hypothetical protein EDEG_03575 [Edhazardia aedis USNM 41457]
MRYQQNNLFKFLYSSQVLRYIQLLYLCVNFVKASQPELKKSKANPPLWPEPYFSSENHFDDIIEKIMKLLKTAEEIRDGDIINDESLLRYKSCQYPLVLKEYASEAVILCTSLLNDSNNMTTENLKKFLDFEQFFIEAEAYEPNPITSYFVFSCRHKSAQLFNLYLKEKMEDLIELPLRIHGFHSDELDEIIRKMAGPVIERIDIIYNEVWMRFFNTPMSDMCRMQ